MGLFGKRKDTVFVIISTNPHELILATTSTVKFFKKERDALQLAKLLTIETGKMHIVAQLHAWVEETVNIDTHYY